MLIQVESTIATNYIMMKNDVIRLRICDLETLSPPIISTPNTCSILLYSWSYTKYDILNPSSGI
jgi:hypothetical protein